MATLYHLPKKRGALKGTQISFLRDAFRQGLSQWRLHWGCRGLSFVLDLSDQIYTFVLHGLAWYCWLFVYLCLMRCCIYFCCMIFCCLYCLLKAFLNCHCVCHSNNNVCTPFIQFVVVVTMDHRSSLDSGTLGRIRQLIAQSHWIISCWL